jgi:5-(carboxyamino)imidazole ribonucleotide mutase
MPSGIPVATVAIDGAVNAALLAIEMLSLSDEGLEKKLADKRAKDTATVLEKNKAVEDKYNN